MRYRLLDACLFSAFCLIGAHHAWADTMRCGDRVIVDGESMATVRAFCGPPTVVQHSVSLSWQPSTSQVTGYNVYRSGAAAGPFARINPALNARTAYVDGTVAASQTYYYVTTAVNSSGQESTYSNQVQVAIP